jgi:ABC-type Na+ transport system ATPase subunit NatA
MPNNIVKIWQHCSFCIHEGGALAVFGGENGSGILDSIEVLNGTIWATIWLKSARSGHAMVQLPCP